MTNPDHDSLYQVSESHGGYFTATEARSAGFSRSLLTHHTKSGLFGRVAHGVYRLKRFPASPHEDLFIALLRTGPRSVISHASALALYDLTDALPTQVHVTVPRTASRRRRGIRLHTKGIESSEVTSREGLAVTTVPRTIADVAAAGLAEEFVRQAIQEAVDRGLIASVELRRAGRKYGGRAARIIARSLQGLPR
jgi:predicted transcriptional regulator of viral defense system